MSLELVLDGHEFEIELDAQGEGVYEVLVDGEPFEVHVTEDGQATLSTIGEAEFRIDRQGRVLAVDGERVDVGVRHLAQERLGAGSAAGGEITPPMPGQIVEVLVEEGQTVDAGEGLIVLEAMKMQNEIAAPGKGTVTEILVAEGDTVEASDVLLVFEPS